MARRLRRKTANVKVKVELMVEGLSRIVVINDQLSIVSHSVLW